MFMKASSKIWCGHGKTIIKMFKTHIQLQYQTLDTCDYTNVQEVQHRYEKEDIKIKDTGQNKTCKHQQN